MVLFGKKKKKVSERERGLQESDSRNRFAKREVNFVVVVFPIPAKEEIEWEFRFMRERIGMSEVSVIFVHHRREGGESMCCR